MGLVLDGPEGNEKPIQINGLDVLMSDKVKGLANGSLVDYISLPDEEGFIIRSGKSACQMNCCDSSVPAE